MLTKNLYKDILIAPAEGSTDLYVVSGYATAGMVSRHLKDLHNIKDIKINVHLIIGMVKMGGISRANHEGFCELVRKPEMSFKCNYVLENVTQVHTKAYAWFNKNSDVDGFIGSANYTQNGFFRQREAMEKSPAREIQDYYLKLEEESCSCLYSDAEGLVKDEVKFPWDDAGDSVSNSGENLESITTTLLDNNGNLPDRSGLNWGQRDGREPNQAYIKLSAAIGRSGFFPERRHHFTLHTDDGQIFLCSTNQDGGKAIHSDNNSLLGGYFRERIGLPLGSLVTKQDLENYGRTDVTFYKIDDENYLMNFSVKGESV